MSVVDRAYLGIDGTEVYCESIDIEPEDGTDHVTAMTPDNEPIGTASGNRRFTITAKVAMEENENVDWDALWESKTNVKTTAIFEGGTTHTFNKGVVSKPGISASHGEKVTRNIELKAWQRVIS